MAVLAGVEVGMRIEAGHTHLFPGCRLTVTEAGPQDRALVLFSDGVAVHADLIRAVDGAVLAMPYFHTARGTAITPHRWRIAPQGPGADWRVVARAPG